MRRTKRLRMAGIAAVTAALAMASATPAGAASLGGGDDMGFPDYDWANDDSSIVGRFPGARGLGDLDALNIHAVPEAVAIGDAVLGRSSLQQVVGSEQVARLRALPDTQPGVRYAVIVSDDDTTVTPPRAGVPRGRAGRDRRQRRGAGRVPRCAPDRSRRNPRSRNRR